MDGEMDWNGWKNGMWFALMVKYVCILYVKIS